MVQPNRGCVTFKFTKSQRKRQTMFLKAWLVNTKIRHVADDKFAMTQIINCLGKDRLHCDKKESYCHYHFILFFGMLLTLFPKLQILDSSKMKEFADDNFEFDENRRERSPKE